MFQNVPNDLQGFPDEPLFILAVEMKRTDYCRNKENCVNVNLGTHETISRFATQHVLEGMGVRERHDGNPGVTRVDYSSGSRPIKIRIFTLSGEEKVEDFVNSELLKAAKAYKKRQKELAKSRKPRQRKKAEEVKAKKIESLKDELAKLEGE